MVRNNEKGVSRINAICSCESQGTAELGFSTGEIELRNELNGDKIGDSLRGYER